MSEYGKIILKRLLICLAAGALILLFYRCPIKLLTGYDCPGCGLTRAFLCAVRFDFAGAYAYHKLYWLILPETAYFLYRYIFHKSPRLPKSIELTAIVVSMILLLAVWIYKIL